MTEATQTADTNAAREAAKSRVTTQESLVAKLAPPAPAKEEPVTEEKATEASETTDGHKPKNRFQERISEVIAQRKAAEEAAEQAKREADELRARLEALQSKPEPIAQTDRPQRSSYASQEEYEDALTDWKADQRIAKREQEQAVAQAKAEFEAITTAWEKRCQAVKAEIPDFEDVISASEVQVNDHITQALLRSKGGPQLAYFFATHPDEAKKVNRMHPVEGIGYLKDLERELMAPAKVESKTDPKAKPVERSKAPEPIQPVKQAAALTDDAPAPDYATYKARRLAQKH